jgi:hypothetical protein
MFFPSSKWFVAVHASSNLKKASVLFGGDTMKRVWKNVKNLNHRHHSAVARDEKVVSRRVYLFSWFADQF